MRSILKLILVLLIPSSAHAIEPFDFKGVPFGASERNLLEKHPEFECSDSQGLEKVISDRTCYSFSTQKGTYAGVPADLEVHFYANSMARTGAIIDSNSFDHIKRVLVEKYGEPTAEETEAVNTAMGGKYLNEKYKWERKDGMLLLAKFAGKITQSKVSIYSSAGLAEFEKRKQNAIKEGSGDL